jgi:hypothetical protein
MKATGGDNSVSSAMMFELCMSQLSGVAICDANVGRAPSTSAPSSSGMITALLVRFLLSTISRCLSIVASTCTEMELYAIAGCKWTLLEKGMKECGFSSSKAPKTCGSRTVSQSRNVI